MAKRKSEEERIKERILYHRKRIEVYNRAKKVLYKAMGAENLDEDVYHVLLMLDRVLDGWILSAKVSIYMLEDRLVDLKRRL